MSAQGMIPPCYVAAPYGASTSAGLEWHVRRALALGRLARLEGLAPLVVHSSIAHVYGDDDDPAARDRGLECNLEIMRAIMFRSHGRLWILLHDDGSESDGVKAERRIWRRYKGDRGLRKGSWAQWGTLAERHHLGALWRSLARPPTTDLVDLASREGGR